MTRVVAETVDLAFLQMSAGWRREFSPGFSLAQKAFLLRQVGLARKWLGLVWCCLIDGWVEPMRCELNLTSQRAVV